MIHNATDASYEQDVLNSELPVLVDFWAPWCGPCKAMAPALDTFAGGAAGKVKVVKVNIDENPESAMKLGVRGVPTLVLYEKGEAVKRVVGAQSLAKLEAFAAL